ncbi:K02A2.6-like, partial [Cordylochernes scorpioides]
MDREVRHGGRRGRAGGCGGGLLEGCRRFRRWCSEGGFVEGGGLGGWRCQHRSTSGALGAGGSPMSLAVTSTTPNAVGDVGGCGLSFGDDHQLGRELVEFASFIQDEGLRVAGGPGVAVTGHHFIGQEDNLAVRSQGLDDVLLLHCDGQVPEDDLLRLPSVREYPEEGVVDAPTCVHEDSNAKLIVVVQQNGALLLSVDNYHFNPECRRPDYSPMYLLGEKGMEDIEPFLPVQVNKFTDEEFNHYLDYLCDLKWIQHPQDVLRLCKEVDPHMNEEDKISHLMKGIAEELYQALLPSDAHTTEQFVTECRRIEALHCKRVTPTRYERLPNVASLSDHDDRADLSSMIRQMVREEVQRALASPREEPEISAIEHMVQQEIEKPIAPISRSFPQNRAPRPLPSPRYEFQPRNFQPRPQQPKQVNGRRGYQRMANHGRIDGTLDCLREARFYSSMDLQSGYWQIDVEESDREKTAFITPDGLYEFKVMPFGLCNAPATFERMIDNLLKGLKWTICLCYLDDIIVFSDDFEEYLRRLQLVLNCLKKAGLCLNSKKCKFGAKTITVLGHEVSENGIRPDQEKIRAVRDFATPRSLKEVRSFLGLSSYYGRFIPNYAHVAQPLNDLLKKDSAFNWNQEEQNAFEALKSALISEPALGHFDYSSPTEIHTDASNYGIGAVLVQIQKGKERAIAYASRTFNKAEKKIQPQKGNALPSFGLSINSDHMSLDSHCQRRKHQPQLLSGHLQPIPVPTVAFEKVGMDLLGRFPTSEGGNRWIIVCTDYLTKYAITKALPASESMEVAKFFIEDVILKHGAPRELITDRGRNFTSSTISDLNNQCRITHRKTTAYHPQTNGLTERLNKTIADMLSMYVDVNQKDWDRILPFVTFAYKIAKQESTGFTPFFLVHGREAETPLDVPFPKLLPEDDDFIQTLGARAEEARKLAQDQEDHLEEDPEDDSTNFQEVDIPTEPTQQPQTCEEISGPITRSQALRLRMRGRAGGCGGGLLEGCRRFRRWCSEGGFVEGGGLGGWRCQHRSTSGALGSGGSPMSLAVTSTTPNAVGDVGGCGLSFGDDHQLGRELVEFASFIQDEGLRVAGGPGVAVTGHHFIGQEDNPAVRSQGLDDVLLLHCDGQVPEDDLLRLPSVRESPEEGFVDGESILHHALRLLNADQSDHNMAGHLHQLVTVLRTCKKTSTYVSPRDAAERDLGCTEAFDFSTPNEWPKWRKRFERYLVVSGMKKKEEADKIDLFMYLMGDRADDIFRTFKFEKEEEATKIDSVLKAFDSHFCVRKNIIYERAKFNSRIQEDREPVDEFITSLYKLADSCEFEGLHEQLIRDRIVVGVRDKALSERMQLDSELTLEKAVKMVRQQEAVRQQQVDLQRPSTSQKVNQVKFNSKKQSPKKQQQPSRKKEKSAKTRSRCPKCGGFTHREGQACRAEGQKCNLCSKTGHFANCCPDKQAKTAEVKAVSELDQEIGFLLEVSAVEDSSNLDDGEGKCSVCIQEAVSKHEPLIPTNFPTRPWQKIGMDLFKFENKWYLVVIDYYSRYPEMVQLDRLTASVVVRSCKSIFARHGIPETVVSDNGTQFGAAREFANFARQYGFTHVTSSPRFPQSNGMAEAGVKIAKLILKKNQDPSLGLLEYRSTPLENGYSPAELLMGRKLRTTLPIAPENLNPKLVDSQTLKRKEGRRRKDMKSRYDRRCGATDMEELSEGDTVWITDMRTWGIVKKKASTPRSYMVDTPVGTLRRNRFHLRKGVTVQYPADPSTPTFSGEELVENEKTPVVDYPSNDSEDGQIRTRSGRIVKPSDMKSRLRRLENNVADVPVATPLSFRIADNSPQLETTECFPKIKPPTYDGQTSWKCFKTQFEVVALGNRWNSSEKAINLAASLRGSATEVLQFLPLEQSLDYERLIHALTLRFGDDILQPYHVVKLKNRRQKRDETLQELAADVERLASLTGPGLAMRCDDASGKIIRVSSLQGGSNELATEGLVNGLPCRMVIDSGANVTLLRVDLAQRMESISRRIPASNELVLQTATGEQAKVYGQVVLKFQIGNNLFSHLGYLADIKDDCLIGLDVLRKFGFSIDFQENVLKIAGEEIPLVCSRSSATNKVLKVILKSDVKIPPRSECILEGRLTASLGVPQLLIVEENGQEFGQKGLLLARTLCKSDQSNIPIRVVNLLDSAKTLGKGTEIAIAEPVTNVAHCPTVENLDKSPCSSLIPGHLQELLEGTREGLNWIQQKKLEHLLCQYEDVFATSPKDVGRTNVTQHRIDTGGATPVKQLPRRLPMTRRDEVAKLIEEMAEQDVIEPSSSPWASPVVLVKKKDGSTRFCVDYRRLNDLTKKDSYPLPRIDATLDTLSGSQWFSTLDLKSGYWQVSIHPEDREKTAFTTGNGLWQFKVMPFGLCNAPATFERLMETVLQGIALETCLVYLDDIIVMGKSFEEHLINLERVLQKIRGARLKLNPRKCKPFKEKVRYLGHVISRQGIQTDPDRTETVRQWPVPRDVHQLRSFLGLCSYYRRFVPGTDHAALRWLLNFKSPEGQLARWIQRLQEYDMEIQHRKGKSHGNADALSRRPCPVNCKHCSKAETQAELNIRQLSLAEELKLDEWSPEEMRKSQFEDADLRPVMNWLNAGTNRPAWEDVASCSPITKSYWSLWDSLEFRGGVLSRKWESDDGQHIEWKMILPQSRVPSVLKELHNSPSGGHFGIAKTLGKVKERFYWAGCRASVEKWVRQCTECASRKGPKTRSRARLKTYNVGAPVERIAIDIMGPLPRSDKGNRYILVAMDYFTKWPEAFPLADQEAETVAETLISQFFSRFGVPMQIHTDQGRNFESRLFAQMCKLLGSHKTRTTPLHPQSDGMVERFNRTLASQLSLFVAQNQRDWDSQLPILLMAYRSSVHETTGYSPAKMLFGRELKLPCDLIFGCPNSIGEGSNEFVDRLHSRLEKVHRWAREKLEIASEAMKVRYDTHACGNDLQEGGLVWLYNPKMKKGLSPKLQKSWEGPFRIVKKLNDVVFRIQRSSHSKPKVVHFNRLAPFKEPLISAAGEGMEDIEPFLPVQVNKFTDEEFNHYLDYLCDLKWIQHPQ